MKIWSKIGKHAQIFKRNVLTWVKNNSKYFFPSNVFYPRLRLRLRKLPFGFFEFFKGLTIFRKIESLKV